MAFGGVAMIVVGNAGEGVRADVQISVTQSEQFAFVVKSSSSPLYDQAIDAQIVEVAQEFGNPGCRLECLDSGALPFTWRARLTTALRLFTGRSPVIGDGIATKGERSGLCRTRLYIPGNTPKMFPNAGLSKPDAIILDLEESVAPSKKEEALDLVLSGIEGLDWESCEMLVRINPGDAGLHEVRRLASSPVHTFILPKVEGASEVQAIDAVLTEMGSDQRLFPLIESPLGVENAFLIATASTRIRALSLGLEDYLAELGATRSAGQEESSFARSRVLNAARAAGVTPLASVFPGFEDRMALTRYVEVARAQGYEGIGCIHPAQVPIVHEAFRPNEAELAKARAIVAAFESAAELQSGVTSADGQMVDLPTYRRALGVVRRAEVDA